MQGREALTRKLRQIVPEGQAAQPHIFPTYRAMRKRIRSRVTRAINKAVKKAAGK